MIEFEDPRAEPGVPVEAYDLAVDLSGGATIGLLANGFPDSEAFLDHVEKALSAILPEGRFPRYNKRNASATAPPDMVDAIVAECQAVVGAYGH